MNFKLSVLLFLSLFILKVWSQNYRVNCGGPAYTDKGGRAWSADAYFSGGSTANFGAVEINNTNDDPLYQTERYGTYSYAFPITQVGVYRIDLLFAEGWDGAKTKGVRVFTITIQNQKVLTSFDIMNVTTWRTAVNFTFNATVCSSFLSVGTIANIQNPKISAIAVTLLTPISIDLCPPPPPPPAVPLTPRFNYSEAFHKIFLFYEGQRSGKRAGAPIWRLAWRSNSSLDVSNVDGGVDLSGGYYESSNRLKFGLPQAATFTFIGWSIVENRAAYEQTGEIIWALDAFKWQTDFFLNAHKSPNELYGMVGNSNPDFSFCGPPENYNLARPYYKLDPTRPGSEIACEVAALFAIGSMIFNKTDPSYGNLLLNRSRQLYSFCTTYQGSYAQSIPNHNAFYPSGGYTDEIAWAALWLYQATGQTSFLTDATNYWITCCSLEPGWSFDWGTKNAGVSILLYKFTGVQQYLDLVNLYLDAWLPSKSRTVPHTPGGLAFIQDWGPLRFAANTAWIAMYTSKIISSFDPVRADLMMSYGVQQINYILGDNPKNQSYMVGFGNGPTYHYHLASFAPYNNNPFAPNGTRAGLCSNDFYGSVGPNRAINFGCVVGGPTIDDNYNPNSRSSYVRAEPTQDYPAGLAMCISYLILQYDLGPYCVNLTNELGWNQTGAEGKPLGLNVDQPHCQPAWNPPLVTTSLQTTFQQPIVTTGTLPSCISLFDFESSFEYPFSIQNLAENSTYSQTAINYSINPAFVKTGNRSMKIDWFNKDYSWASYYVETYAMNLAAYNTIRFWSIVSQSVQFTIAFQTGLEWNWTAVNRTVYAYAGLPGGNIIELDISQIPDRSQVRRIHLIVSTEFLGPGFAYIDSVHACMSPTNFLTTGATTGSVQTTNMETTSAPTTDILFLQTTGDTTAELKFPGTLSSATSLKWSFFSLLLSLFLLLGN